MFLAASIPKRKKSVTAKVVPLPLPNNDPINIKRNMMVDVIILKCIPITEPIIKKRIINNVFPKPIPKWEPTKAIYIEEYNIDKFVDAELS